MCNAQIEEAIKLAPYVKLKPNDRCGGLLTGPTTVYDFDRPLRTNIIDASFEIRYLIACSILGYTDSVVLNRTVQ